MTTDKMAAVLLTSKGDEILIRPAVPEDAV